MSKAKKIWLIAAACCVVIGGTAACFALAAVDFDFREFHTMPLEQKKLYRAGIL